jgi:hypothetical protein
VFQPGAKKSAGNQLPLNSFQYSRDKILNLAEGFGFTGWL